MADQAILSQDCDKTSRTSQHGATRLKPIAKRAKKDNPLLQADTIRRTDGQHCDMNSDAPSHPQTTACQCPSCVSHPARTYTVEYMQECLARWYVNSTAEQREKYLEVLSQQRGWRQRIAKLKVVADYLGLPTNDFPA